MSTLIKETVLLGKAKYVQGNFYSKKNNVTFPYKSSYELAYLHQLESNPNVHQYIYEPFSLYYVDVNDKRRTYIPDFMVLFIDGKIEITEIKPQIMLRDFDVQSKAKSCREYIAETFKGVDMVYKFITERDLFASDKEYTDFLKSIKE